MTDAIEWKDAYAIGNKQVDDEHRELFRLVGLLLAASENGGSGAAVDDAFAALVRYVDRHFEDEESLLESVGSEHLGFQRAEHRVLRQELATLWNPSREISNEETVAELAVWARQRLLRHFLTADARAFRSPSSCVEEDGA